MSKIHHQFHEQDVDLGVDDEEPIVLPKKMVEGVGNEAGYLARSEGVSSRGMIGLARKALIDPADLTGEEIRKLAAAILAHEKYGK